MKRVLDLGTKAYAEALGLQMELVRGRASEKIPDTLLLLEHDHVITLGRKTTAQNLKPQSIPVFQTDRGGDATYHGPGQLVGYPIFKLESHDVRLHVRNMEAALEATAQLLGIHAGRVEGHPGLWCGGKKLASIGVAVTNWVTYHGFALNVNTDLSYFELIRPCGLDPDTMTSMAAILGCPIDMGLVKRRFVSEYARVLGEPFSEGPEASIPA